MDSRVDDKKDTAMPTHTIDLKHKTKTIVPALPKLGGTNPAGDRINFTNYFMELNGRPFFGIAGEIHFARLSPLDWDDEILKMKLGGINIIATYIFWIHHEEEEGVFNWEGDRNLRGFVDLCAKHGLYVILRVGPFCHGECRNGGLPDWLYGRPFDVRSNDERYLAYVRRLYAEIGRQVRGQFFQDGGPVIGVQLENEFMAAAAPWEIVPRQAHEWITGGSGGVEHMRRLKQIAVECGLQAPIYTATAWGSPVLEGETLPMFGGYAYCPWEISPERPVHRATGEFVFQSYHDNAVQAPGLERPFPPEAYPFTCAEMGGGMQSWYQYRFVVPPESVDGMAVQKIAGGCNLIGYYMYHGGLNPEGKTFLNEHVTPKISYDFQAPLGEFGQVRPSYHHLKLVHLFASTFAEELCRMGTVLPPGSERITPEDVDTLRWAVRVRDGAGFVFLNNTQDHVAMHDQAGLQFALEMEGETIAFPRSGSLTLKKESCAILPFNLQLGSVLLKFATLQPLTRLETGEGPTYFFFAPEGLPAEYGFDRRTLAGLSVSEGTVVEAGDLACVTVRPGRASLVTLTTPAGQTIRICTLTRQEALSLWKVDLWGQERIILCAADLLTGEGCLRLSGQAGMAAALSLYPDVSGGLAGPSGRLSAKTEGIFTTYALGLPAASLELAVERPQENKAVVRLPAGAFTGLKEIFLKIEYIGDLGYAFIDGRLVHDNFNNGAPWEIGLRRFEARLTGRELYFYVTPFRKDRFVASDSPAVSAQIASGAERAEIRSIQASLVVEVKVVRNQ
jgi:beta-galactosidase